MRVLSIRFSLLLCLVFPALTSAVTPMVTAGHNHTVALTADSTVMAWGSNNWGQLGDGTTTNRPSPTAVPGPTGVVAVTAGFYYSVALKTDGTVMAWGYNGYGQLGDGTTTYRPSPTTVPGLTTVVAISAGDNHTVALKADGTVTAWGANGNGHLGDGTTTNRPSPTAVPGLTEVVAVTSGSSHTVALKADGTVMAWGYNGYGQLGDGTITTRLSPTAVPGLSGVVAVTAGSSHTVALKADGTVMAWGEGFFGQLGNGTTTTRLSPTAVPGLTGVVAVTAGYSHTVALKADGTVMAWGYNALGQLGDGFSRDQLSPIAVPGLTGVVAMTAGGHHTVALKVDGTVMAWGYNDVGQLGDGTNTTRLSPTAVPSMSLGIIPPTSVSPTSLNFAPQTIGTSSNSQSLTFTNTESTALNFISIFVGGDFTRTTSCGSTVAAGASCSISVTFTPTGTGARNGGLTIVSNGVILSSANLSGTGEGPIVSLGSTALSFAAQNLGTTSAAKTVTLTNTGNLALNIASIGASGDYGVTHNCGIGLGAGGFCALNITFTPTASGTRSGAVTITNNTFNSPQTISLSGTGQGGVVSLSATSKTFASQNMGTTSAAQSITLTNTGGAVLNIASIVASGDFARTTTCGATLAQTANCTISVTFTPTATGARNGSVIISSDAASNPNLITVSGTGVGVPLVSLNPTSLSFAGQNIGAASTPKTVTLTNSGGANLTFTSISANGDFTVTNNCGSGLGAGGSCTLTVTFAPTAAGARTGSIVVTSNAASSPNTIPLGGAGNTPPSAPTLNSIAPGAGSATLSFTAPADNGGTAIASYTGTCTANGETTRTTSAFGSPLVVGGLTGGVAYLCSLTATNDGGLTSGPSAAMSVTPLPANKKNLSSFLMLLLD